MEKRTVFSVAHAEHCGPVYPHRRARGKARWLRTVPGSLERPLAADPAAAAAVVAAAVWLHFH